jgi:hypothetical protein
VPYIAAIEALLRRLDATNVHAELLTRQIESLLIAQEEHDDKVASAKSRLDVLPQASESESWRLGATRRDH